MERKWYRFIFAEDSDDLTGGGEKTLFLIWNVAAFLLSSAALCAVSLNFAIGDMPLYYIYLTADFPAQLASDPVSADPALCANAQAVARLSDVQCSDVAPGFRQLLQTEVPRGSFHL